METTQIKNTVSKMHILLIKNLVNNSFMKLLQYYDSLVIVDLEHETEIKKKPHE